jgi:hypothetical protein
LQRVGFAYLHNRLELFHETSDTAHVRYTGELHLLNSGFRLLLVFRIVHGDMRRRSSVKICIVVSLFISFEFHVLSVRGSA